MKTVPVISVITPYHNVEHFLFQGAAKSIATQSLGLENIEWVIVVHNSTQGEEEFVRSVVEPLGCALVYVLENDVHSASSPRNYALSLVSGEYITFLDADDTLTPECLLTIVKGMDETGADIGKYRGELTEGDEGIVRFLDNRVRFPQTKPLLLLRKDSDDIKKLLTMTNMMMSCQVIRRSFLEKYAIRFREDVCIEEDVIFNLLSISHAETIAVFPQLIGCVYYMHQGSTMQEKNLTSQALLRTSSDLAKQLDIGLDAGLYMNYLFVGHMQLISAMIERSNGDVSTRRTIRNIFLPYFKKIKMPVPDGKILTDKILDETRAYIEDTVLFLDDPTMGDGILRKIVRENRSTELGLEWDFENIFDHDDYITKVPITCYDNYAPYIELTTRIGESDIFIHDSIKGYAITSGSTGVPRRIPYSAIQLKYFSRIIKEIENCPSSTYLMMQSIRSDEQYADGTYLDSITGAILQSARKRLKYLSCSLLDKKGSITSPEEHVYLTEPFMASYKRLLYALLDKDVQIIFAPFSWQVFSALKKLEEDPKHVIANLTDGSVVDSEKYMDRIKELEAILNEGFDNPIALRIWPGLTKIIAGNSGAFKIYGDNLKRYIGDIPIEGYYASSEGIHGVYNSKYGGYTLLSTENYYEFLKPEEKTAVMASDVVPGEIYQIIITNRSGFYRYALGDMVKIISIENGIPVFDVLYRRSDMLFLAGSTDYITPDEIYMSIKELSLKTGCQINDYCYAMSEDDDHLELFLETAKNDSLSKMADTILSEISKAYKTARECHKIGSAVCLFVEPETQEAYSELIGFRAHASSDQIKPVRYLDNPVKRHFFESMLI